MVEKKLEKWLPGIRQELTRDRHWGNSHLWYIDRDFGGVRLPCC